MLEMLAKTAKQIGYNRMGSSGTPRQVLEYTPLERKEERLDTTTALQGFKNRELIPILHSSH
jgi:hypothetical protein